MAKFNAKQWVEHEVENLIDCYGGDRVYQLEFVHDQLVGDEYRDALTDTQAFKAAVAAKTLLEKAKAQPASESTP